MPARFPFGVVVNPRLAAARAGKPAAGYCACSTRTEMSKVTGLDCMANALHAPEKAETVESDMQLVEL